MANQVTTTFSINANQALQQLAQYQQQLRNTIQLQTQLGSGATNPGGGGGGGGTGGNGFWLDAAAEIGVPQRVIASYAAAGAAIAAVTVAGQQLVNFYVRSTELAIGVERANRLLTSSAKELGQTYSDLSQENRKFADLVGVSNTEAARTTAQIARLAANSGMTQIEDVQRLTRAFADLGAARGIAGADLETLIGTILSGQDEGLNRLGIADPGALQREYAKSIGTTSDKLTQQQKVLAAVNAVLSKANDFTGAAEQRMRGLEGSVANATKAWQDFAEAVSTSVANNQTLRLLLTGASTGLRILTPGSGVRERISGGAQPSIVDRIVASLPGVGESTISGLALRAAPGPLKIGVGAGLALRRIFEGQKAISDAQMASMGEENMKIFNANKKREEEALQAYKDRVAGEIAEEDGKFKRMSAMEDAYYRLRQARSTEFLAKNAQEEMAQAKAVAALRIEAAEAAYIRQKGFLDEQIESLGKLADLGDQQAEERQKKLIEERDFDLPKRQLEIELLRIEASREQQRLERAAAEDAKRRVLELRSVIADAAGDRNPFVTIFENAAKAVERVRELAKGLGGDLERRALEAVRSQNFAALTEARYGAALQSFNLRSSAADFRSGINLEALTPMQENRRRLRQLRGQLESIGAFQQGPLRPALDAEASESQRRQAETRYQEDLRRFEAERAVRDRQIVELTQGFNPARLDAQTRELAAGAREREAVRVGRQEEEARKLFAELSSALKNGVPVTLASGEQVVRIVNEAPDSATVTTRPSPAATSGRYSN